jgi:hypothetical protein
MSWGERYQQKSSLTLTHWVMVNNSTNINQNHLSLNSLSDGQQFHQYQQKSQLRWEMIFVDIGGIVDITQCVDVRGDFYWYWWNWWPSLFKLSFYITFITHFVNRSDGIVHSVYLNFSKIIKHCHTAYRIILLCKTVVTCSTIIKKMPSHYMFFFKLLFDALFFAGQHIMCSPHKA